MFLKKISVILFFTFALNSFSQTYSGSTGLVSDDGAINDFYATVSGMVPSAINASHGLVTVCLNITHTYDSDLNIHLVSPDGTEINLISGLGGPDDNFTNTCLDQSAPTSIITGTAPFTGSFKPQETLGNMNNGQNGNGTWILRIVDTYAADIGNVLNWSITFGSGAAAPIVFSSSNLPIVIINTSGVGIPDEPKINGTMGIIYNGPGAMNYVTDTPNDYNGKIGIEVRGAYSASLPQKPFAFETRDSANLESNVSLLSMPAEHDWCLLANYNDKVFMRNTLSFKLFNEMGHYAARTRFCEVVVNGSYQGIYILCESIKRDANRVNLARLDSTENTGINVTGGYIFKNDYWDGSNSWLLNYHPIDHPTFNVHLVYDYPKPTNITPQQKTYLQTFVNDFETALYATSYADPVNGFRKYCSETSFVDYLIVNELSRNNDGFKKSRYFHKEIDGPTSISKIKAGPVWDFDWAWKDIWGCSIFDATDGSGWAHHINDCGPDVNSPGWYVRMMQDTSFQNEFRCRWENFRTSILSNSSLNGYIDSIGVYLDSAQMRHFEKWGNLGVNTGAPEVQPDPTTFAGELAQFKNWLALRLTWMDANVPGNANNCSFVGIQENHLDYSIVIFPNPSSSNVSIQAIGGNRLPERIEICDMTGKTLMTIEGNSNTISIDVSQLANGIYFCKLIDKNSVVKTERIVVMH